MTAVAYRDGLLAVDSLSCSGGFRLSRPVMKARTIELVSGKFGLVTGSGRAAVIDRALRWMDSHLKSWDGHGQPLDMLPALADDDGTDTVVFVLLPNRSPIVLSSAAPPDTVDAPWLATGEFQFLMGAMAAGKSAARAVALACEYSVHCGWPVNVYDHDRGLVATLRDPADVYLFEQRREAA